MDDAERPIEQPVDVEAIRVRLLAQGTLVGAALRDYAVAWRDLAPLLAEPPERHFYCGGPIGILTTSGGQLGADDWPVLGCPRCKTGREKVLARRVDGEWRFVWEDGGG